MPRLAAPLLLCFVLAAAPAPAQIVNVQARFSDRPEPGLHGAAEGAVDWRTGSNEFLTLRGALTLQGAAGDHLILGLLQGEYGLSNRVRTLGRTLEHLRYRYRLGERVSLEAFVQHEYNPFRRLELRGLFGVGPRVHLLDGEQLGLVVGVAPMLEHERLRRDEQPDAGLRTTEFRASSYLLGRLKVMEGLTLVQTFYVQPRIDAPADLRLLNETALVAKANERVAMSLGLVVFYDRAPAEGVAPLDTQVRSALGVSF